MIRKIIHSIYQVVLITGIAWSLFAPSNAWATPMNDTSDTVFHSTSLRQHYNFNIDDIFGAKLITCYPNPAVSYINFKFDASVKPHATLYVYNFTGRKMESLPVTGKTIKITLSKYYRGLYVYQLRDAKGIILESGKFQVKK